ncbi:MAG: AraC family transcriptional regulator, partial [Clostridiaceae bacterium]|nr:AraC family transcriptional regulator [Clostridiaceae bacterium]
IKSIDNTDSQNIVSLKPQQISSNTITAALKYINNNYNQEINLDAVAAFVHLNSQYLSRYFKQKVGMTFTQYIKNLRIENAKKLLASSDKSITQISLEVGYFDAAYFSKVFSRQEKQSPYKFRTSHKKNI